MSLLDRYGRFAAHNPEVVIGIAIVFTVIMGSFALQLEIETDFEKSLPQHLPTVQNAQLLQDTFEEPQTFFVLVTLNDDQTLSREIQDIRDPQVMIRLLELEQLLQENTDVQQVFGPPDVLLQATGSIPEDPAVVNAIFADSQIISNDLTATLVFIETNLGQDDEKILAFVQSIEEDIAAVGFPGSLSLTVTGGPLIQTTIFDLLLDDLVRTVGIAAFFILVVLIVAYRSPTKGSFAVVLLLFSLVWTGGTMQFLNIPLSIITVMVGSLIIGIGIDYTIHIMNRYAEERKKKKSPGASAGIAVNKVGVAILATSVTTIVSFLSQAGAGIPLMTHMGIALSLGIAYAMVASIFVLPSLVVVEEQLVRRLRS